MTATTLPIDIIVRDPEVRSGSPVVIGTTIRVSDLAAYHVFDGLSPDQLAVQFDLGLTEIHAALAYYYGHRDAIDTEIRANTLDVPFSAPQIDLVVPIHPVRRGCEPHLAAARGVRRRSEPLSAG